MRDHRLMIALRLFTSETTMTSRLLMIDDDVRLVQMIGKFLGQSGFSLVHAATGRAGMDCLAMESTRYDLVLLELVLPDIDGLEVCRTLRSSPKGSRAETPILMLTAKAEPMDRIIGLESGADDYLTKPFNPHELLARIRAILRRVGPVPDEPSPIMRFGSLAIDQVMRTVSVDDRLCKLTQSQFDLLLTLAHQAGKVLTRGYLMKSSEHRPSLLSVRAIDVQIWRIRQAIESDAKMPKRIITVSGAGYLFAKQQD